MSDGRMLMQSRSLRVELTRHREHPEKRVLVITRTMRHGAERCLLIHEDEIGDIADALDEADLLVNPEIEDEN